MKEDKKLIWDYLQWLGQTVTHSSQYTDVKILTSLGGKYLISFNFNGIDGFLNIAENRYNEKGYKLCNINNHNEGYRKDYIITDSGIGNERYVNPDDILQDLKPLLRDIKLNEILKKEECNAKT